MQNKFCCLLHLSSNSFAQPRAMQKKQKTKQNTNACLVVKERETSLF